MSRTRDTARSISCCEKSRSSMPSTCDACSLITENILSSGRTTSVADLADKIAENVTSAISTYTMNMILNIAASWFCVRPSHLVSFVQSILQVGQASWSNRSQGLLTSDGDEGE